MTFVAITTRQAYALGLTLAEAVALHTDAFPHDEVCAVAQYIDPPADIAAREAVEIAEGRGRVACDASPPVAYVAPKTAADTQPAPADKPIPLRVTPALPQQPQAVEVKAADSHTVARSNVPINTLGLPRLPERGASLGDVRKVAHALGCSLSYDEPTGHAVLTGAFGCKSGTLAEVVDALNRRSFT